LTGYRKHTTKAINPSATSTKISSLVSTENYCKWNKNILASTPFLSGMTACKHAYQNNSCDITKLLTPPSLLSQFV